MANGIAKCNIYMVMMSQQMDILQRDSVITLFKTDLCTAKNHICGGKAIRNCVDMGPAGPFAGKNRQFAYKFILWFLVQINLLFCTDIALHSSIVIQMFFMKIQKNCQMGGKVKVFQLVAGKFADNPCIRSDFFQNIKCRYSDNACQNHIPFIFL